MQNRLHLNRIKQHLTSQISQALKPGKVWFLLCLIILYIIYLLPLHRFLRLEFIKRYAIQYCIDIYIVLYIIIPNILIITKLQYNILWKN